MIKNFVFLLDCRLEVVTFHQLEATMQERIWFLYWMLLGSNILPIGFLLHFFGRPWTLLTKQLDILEGLSYDKELGESYFM